MNTKTFRNVSFVLFVLGMMYMTSQQTSAMSCDDYYVGTTHIWECVVANEGPFYDPYHFESCGPWYYQQEACNHVAQLECEQLAGSQYASGAWGWWSVYPESFEAETFRVTYGEIHCEYPEY